MEGVNPGIFKAYDIRGIYPRDLNDDIAYLIGRAFVTFLNAEQVVVGHDMRVSGPAVFDAVTRGITDQGADVLNIGLVSTDQYYFACSKLGLPGMMVTASHNPKEYNGFKMVRKMPQLLSGNEGIQDLRRLVASEDFPQPSRKGDIIPQNFREEFIQSVLSLIDVSTIKPLKVVADTGNGTVGPILSDVYKHLPVDLIGLYLEPDGTLPNHGLDPLQPENRAELEQRVVAEQAAVGLAFDGDGDRFFAIDDRGKFIPGDFLTALLGSYILKKYPGSKIIRDVRSSWAVADKVKENGGIPLVERVGHAFMKQRMASENAVFAGEVSGHYYFRDFNCADSGIIPSLIILEMLSTTGKTMSEMLSELEATYFISGEINSTVDDQQAKIEELAQRYSDGQQDRMDGLSVSFPTWHFNVRPSNTEPLLRLNLEAKTHDEMEQRRDEVLAIIRG
jgi:phosphomannomutase